MIFTKAITRKPGDDFAGGMTTSNLGPPDYKTILKQYDAYVSALKSIGIDVVELDPLPGYPDAYFVEDTAVVMKNIAVITNPGADSRKGEVDSIEARLAMYRRTVHITKPGTLDGGDVLEAGKHYFIGLSERTNKDGAEQLGRIIESKGASWSAVTVQSGLHLKSCVNYVGNNTLLITKAFSEFEEFSGYNKIILDQKEEYAANTLYINKSLIIPKGFPATKKKLEVLNKRIIELDVSEMRKMDGGLTCLSLRF